MIRLLYPMFTHLIFFPVCPVAKPIRAGHHAGHHPAASGSPGHTIRGGGVQSPRRHHIHQTQAAQQHYHHSSNSSK